MARDLDMSAGTVSRAPIAASVLRATNGTVIPTIVVSAARALPSCYGAHVMRFLAKPFHIEELAGWVDQLAHAPTESAALGS